MDTCVVCRNDRDQYCIRNGTVVTCDMSSVFTETFVNVDCNLQGILQSYAVRFLCVTETVIFMILVTCVVSICVTHCLCVYAAAACLTFVTHPCLP